MSRRGAASAPGSSANLGPGFDVLAIAWQIRCQVTVTKADVWRVRQSGEEWMPRDGEFVKRAAQAGGPGPFTIEIVNDIPRSRGLGSSAAVAASVAAAAFRASDVEPSDEELFAIVRGLDGHGDNAAAAVFGGLVMVDRMHHARLSLHDGLRFIAAVPAAPLKTSDAREALPEQISRPTVVRSLARFGFLLRALETGERSAFERARGDELHEAPRAPLSPISEELIQTALDAGALYAAWSGAGPTVLALANDEEVPAVMAALDGHFDGRGDVFRLVVAEKGWE